MTRAIKLYGMSGSGNCYKPALLMRQRGIEFQWQEVDVMGGETRSPAYIAKNPNGKVPLLELQPGEYLAESNAMLCYLAEGSDFLPTHQLTRARVMEWLFFEQYSHEPYIATVRFWVHYAGKGQEWREKIAQTMVKGHAALAVMEQRLGRSPYLACGHYTIADIALYAYTHVAHQGGYQLDRYPALRRWLARVETQGGYCEMAAACA